MVKRDNFSETQREATFRASANHVRLLWPGDFKTSPADHYMCAHCRFVHSDRSLFEVDHIVSCLEGGLLTLLCPDRIRNPA